MELLILIIFCIVLVVAFLLGYKFFKSNACYVIGIGGIVSANVYNIGNFGVVVGGITFGIDSIIYTVAIFCVAVMLIDFNKQEAMKLTYTYMASLLLTAVTDFTIKFAMNGLGVEMIWGFYSYIASIVATYLAVRIAVFVYEKTEKKIPTAFDLVLFIVVASVVNSLVYFGLMAIIGGDFTSFLVTIAGSYLAKFFTLIVFVCFYLLFRNKILNNATMQENQNKDGNHKNKED